MEDHFRISVVYLIHSRYIATVWIFCALSFSFCVIGKDCHIVGYFKQFFSGYIKMIPPRSCIGCLDTVFLSENHSWKYKHCSFCNMFVVIVGPFVPKAFFDYK